MKRPLIGITGSRMIGGAWSTYSPGHFLDYTFDQYSRAVTACGGVPVIIPAAQNDVTVAELIRRLDGVLLSGGPDIHPRHYGQAPLAGLGDIDDGLDQAELKVAAAALAAGRSLLAVCRGIQMLNVAMGGSLIQDLERQVPDGINHRQPAGKDVLSHTVRIEKPSRLHRIVRRRQIWVNGRHHQAIDRVADGLLICARAPDGVIEAVETPGDPFVLGVQWHPEGTWHHDRFARALFAAFVKAAT